MPFKVLDKDAWKKGVSRTLIVGPPNSLKTSSIATWPRDTHWISYPGEKGHSSIPADEPGIHAYVWEADDLAKFSPSAVITEIEKLTIEILTLKHGPIVTFAGDGLHKLYEFYFLQELAALKQVFGGSSEFSGATDEELEEKLSGKAYGRAHSSFKHYLDIIGFSSVQHAVFTIWDGEEKDNPDNKRGGSSHVFPDLPGKMARRIMGEFPIVLAAKVSLPDPQGRVNGTWQTRPGGKIWGAGIKVPPEVAKRIPAEVPQNWPALYNLIVNEPVVQPKPTAPGPMPGPNPMHPPKPVIKS